MEVEVKASLSEMAQHSGLSLERWAAFSLDQQVLMIANEMYRAAKLEAPEDRERQRSAYERTLQLTDLTVQVSRRRALRRELLRWRDLVAALYIAPGGDPAAHTAALRALLRLTPEASKQLPLLARAQWQQPTRDR
jgi:hypothetical protein